MLIKFFEEAFGLFVSLNSQKRSERPVKNARFGKCSHLRLISKMVPVGSWSKWVIYWNIYVQRKRAVIGNIFRPTYTYMCMHFYPTRFYTLVWLKSTAEASPAEFLTIFSKLACKLHFEVMSCPLWIFFAQIEALFMVHIRIHIFVHWITVKKV